MHAVGVRRAHVCVVELCQQVAERAEVFATHRALDRALSGSRLMLGPDLHALDVDVIATAKSDEGEHD